MIAVKMSFRAFMDARRMMALVDKAKRRKMFQAAGYVRTTAMRMIRQRKSISRPGQPPHSHEGTLRRRMAFEVFPGADGAIVGPLKTNQVFFGKDRQPVSGTIPQILEDGGAITLLEVQRSNGTWRRADLRSRRRMAGRPTRYRTANIKARPYMKPALAKAVDGKRWMDIWGSDWLAPSTSLRAA